jgi:hypothetical protein
MKQLIAKATLGILLATGLYASPASAATVKNGINCSKSGATMKVGSKAYRCAKNPYVKSSRLTWTLRGCLNAYAMWKDAKHQYEDWADIAKLAGPEGEGAMLELEKSIQSLEDLMSNNVCKKGA